MRTNKILILILLAFSLTHCGSLFDQSASTTSASESADLFTADLTAIDDDGSVLVVIPVDPFIGDGDTFGDSSFDIALNGATVASERADDNYFYDDQQVATSYSEVRYTITDVVDTDTITITITSVDDATIVIEGTASAEEDTMATQI